MNIISKSDMNVHFVPDSIQFSLFTTEQIKDMCVIRIVSPLTLDPLGHPLPGGLYDTRLGPLRDRGDLCSTCNKTMICCPGHFGYIDLPLPVVNPLFHKIIGTILRMSCLSCYRIQLPDHIKRSITIQLKLIDCGLVTLALEVEATVNELISKYKSLQNIPEDEVHLILKYEKIAEETFEKLGCSSISSQNTETLRNHFMNQQYKEFVSKPLCMYCKNVIPKIQLLKNRIIMTARKNVKNYTQSKGKVTAWGEPKYVTPKESRECMRNIWKAEKDFLQQIVSVLADIKLENPTDALYFEVIPVPPPNVRPINFVADKMMENPQSQAYKKLLQNVILLGAIIQVVQKKGDVNLLTSAEAKAAYSYASGNTPIEKLNNAWEELQNDVNSLLDRESGYYKDGIGLKQLIEKKQGIIRMNMMGKRVNFSARSVITPDPNLNIDEIGIPEEFAKKLTYPVAVTPWNVEELRKMILNGPNVHPGAVMVEFNGTVKRINPNNQTQQESILKCLLTPEEKSSYKSVKIVHRHLCNGDILLLNRQPTLHKPSIMAHKARILKGEKTLRLHYANCKAYNADFDGDEMNAHFPQNELARSEGYNIVNVSNQYLVPKDGTPLSGLIQDHMIAGVRLSLRGRFFQKDDYQQLIFQALSFKTTQITLLPPAIMKPVPLWSGKQILSTVIINIIPRGKQPINLTATSKIPAKAWQTNTARSWQAGGTPFTDPITMSEAEVIIRGGELLVGILDKTHYGATPYGLVHCIYELYGGSCATRLLSSFAKLFMRFLQQEGFTLGVKDILCVKKADKKRKRIIENSRKIGNEVITTALDLPTDTPSDEIVEKIERNSAVNPKLRAMIDRHYKSALDSYTNDINKVCLSAGLVCKFPKNNLQMMVQSGAKGSTVNTMQISCLLGQIELEGKRPPVMISGKSLPSFPLSDFSPRAGGFIDGRFMTGIQPQEFFFHCMAGREGLIDTAVKTSRSGYLQRCLIKHLEGLHIGYDMTVRNSDNSVIQFLYGEDGMDISKAQFFHDKQLKFLYENTKALTQKEVLRQLKEGEDQELIKQHHQKIVEWKLVNGDPLEKERKSPFIQFSEYINNRLAEQDVLHFDHIKKLWDGLEKDVKQNFQKVCERCPDPLPSVFQPDSHYGAINERLEKLIDDFPALKKKKEFKRLMMLKVMQSTCQPGEPVGLLAAQSIGEPSTQMTLNTFHFAGRGEMNVTLGIPRLREILMMASKNIKTPSMEIPFLSVPNLDVKANKLRKMLTRVVLSDVLEKIDVTVELQLQPVRQHKYTLRFHFLPKKYYSKDYWVKPKRILEHVKKVFFGEMFSAIKKHSKINSNVVMMEEDRLRKTANTRGEDDDDEEERPQTKDKTKSTPRDEESSSDDESEDEEDAKTTNKYKETHEDQEPEEGEVEGSDDDFEAETESKPEQEQDHFEESIDNVVVDSYNHAQNYTEDKHKFLWCELTFGLPLNVKKLDLTALLRDVASKSVVWQTPQIKRAITYMKNDTLTLRTDGINIVEIFKFHALLDLQKLYCNDIHKVAETYGIEAASKIIVKEVKDVFNVYGIKVDPRHMSLIADYMTFNGTFEPLSRRGMESSASPLQQISFESSLAFLKTATIRGKKDDLQNPSSSIMLGKPCKTGTGSFSLIQKLPSVKTIV